MQRVLPCLLFLLFCCRAAEAQTNPYTATGLVRNERGEQLEGATVSLQNPTNGYHRVTSSDGKGLFSFSQVPVGGGYQFIISYVNYESDTLSGYEMKTNGRISLSIVLHNKQSDLDKVVVIGYGVVRKKDLSASVADVPNMEQLKEQPVLDVPTMLEGRVPGVTIIQNGGHPDQTPTVTIRGTGSLNGGESVLFVVDGVPNAPYNPADVVSVTILKDAASAAIYGAFSGSAGVVLIGTRQATKGNPGVQYESFTGVKTAWRLPQSLTADKTAQVANLAYTNAGYQPLDGWDPTKNPNDMVTRTDWIHSIFRTGVVTRQNLTLNAGTDKFSVLFGGRYEENQGTLLNTYNKNVSGRMSAIYTFNPYISFKQDVFINNNDSRGTSTSSGYDGTILSAIYMPRSATVYYPDGTFGGVGPRNSPYLGIHGDAVNPVATLLRNQAYNRTTEIQSVSELKVTNIIRGLSVLTRFSYWTHNWLNKNFQPERTEPGKPDDQNELTWSTDKQHRWIWETTANYERRFGRHSLALMGSTTAQDAADMGFQMSGKGFANEDPWAQFFVNATNYSGIVPQDYQNEDRNLSYVGRASYSWADRYFLTGSYRYDIAGRLAPGHRGNGLPGATAAWKISSEPFFHIAALDLLKIRASWGRIGNLGSLGLYNGYPTLTPDYTYQIGNGGPYSPALYLSTAFNPQLTWETSEQKDLGADIGLWHDRLTLTLDYFNKETFNLIQTQSLDWPTTMGLNPPSINQGKIRNTGFEFSATWRGNIRNLGYELGGNFATLKNDVVDINGDPKAVITHSDAWRGVLLPYRSTVGQPYYSYWLVKTAGIFQSNDEVAKYVGPNGTPIQPNAKAGDLKFVDQNHDGKIDDNDRVYMGNAFPKLTYGFNLGLTWKRFDFAMFLQGVSGVKLFHAFKESTLNGSEQGYNRWDKILGAWSPTNTHSNIPIISAADPNGNFSTASDWYLESGNYMRIKNVTIGYTWPRFIRNSSLRLYLTGDNLLTFTKYSGMDPEVGGIGLDGGQFPVSRAFAAGIKLTL